ncbi:MAG: hypothetical protein WC222_12515, partial [Parachlamydiales bacterium]
MTTELVSMGPSSAGWTALYASDLVSDLTPHVLSVACWALVREREETGASIMVLGAIVVDATGNLVLWDSYKVTDRVQGRPLKVRFVGFVAPDESIPGTW